MGTDYADLDIETGVAAIKNIVMESNSNKNGKFLNLYVAGKENNLGPNQYDGSEQAW